MNARALFPVVLGLVAACGSGSTRPAPPSSPVARFVLGQAGAPPGFLEVPFPTDAYLQGGHVLEPIPGIEAVFAHGTAAMSHALGQMDGFSRTTAAMFYVDDPTAAPDANGAVAHATIDPTSLPTDEASCTADASATFLIDLEPKDPSLARIPCRAAFHDDSPHGSATHPVLTVGPARGILLEEQHRYAAVLTSRVKDAAGRAIAASTDFHRVGQDRTTPLGALYGGAMDAVLLALGPALQGDKAEVVAIAPFTTHGLTRDLFQMRDDLEDAPAPVLAWDAASLAPMGAVKFAAPKGGSLPAGFTATLDAWLGVVSPTAKLPDGSDDPDDDLPVHAHDKIAAIGTAAFQATNYLVHKPAGFSDPDDATFARDASGRVVPAPGDEAEKIWISIAVPTAPMPPSGYPAVIIQHGLSGSRAYLLDLANVFANKGWIAVAIDSLTFGARAPEPMYQLDQQSTWASAPGATYQGPDGLADLVNGATNGPGDLFGGFLSLSAARDQFRQAEIDTAQVVKLLRSHPDLSALATGAGAPRIDPDKIAYMGDSLGAIQGAVAAAIEPYVRVFTLNVLAGDVLSEAACHAPSIGTLLGAAGGALFGFLRDYFDESHPLIILMETLIEAGDPIDYAPFLVRSPHPFKGAPTLPRNVLQVEVLYDELLGNEGAEALARAAGMGLAVPNVGSNAGIRDLKNLTANLGRVPLPDVSPDGQGLIHDTPVQGFTAVVVQASPGGHGADIVRGKYKHSFAIPYAKFDTDEPFTALDPTKRFFVKDPYRELQGTMTRFFADAFQGVVPNVTGFLPPVRDFDGDGATDDVDRDPSDPTVQ